MEDDAVDFLSRLQKRRVFNPFHRIAETKLYERVHIERVRLGIIHFGKVSDVKRSQRAIIAAVEFRKIFLVLNDAHHFVVDAPKREQIAADFGLRGAEMTFLGFSDRKAEAFGKFVHFGAFFGRVCVDDDAANVVKQSCQKGAITGVEREPLRPTNAARNQTCAQTVVPKLRGRRFFAGMFFVTGESLQPENKAAHRFDADELDRFGDADDFVAYSEFGGIDDLQKFGGNGHVLLDDFRDVLHGGNGRFENFFDFEERLGRAGQGADAANDAADFVIGDKFAEIRQPQKQFGQGGVIARFTEIPMAHEKAAGDFEAVGVSGNDDARAVGLMLDDVAKEPEPIHVWHGEIGHDRVELT